MILTIFTPTFNRERTLKRVFESLMEQTDKRFEWLIVDDGSTDNTDKVVDELTLSADGFNVRYYKQAHCGKPSAQNWALDLAKGEFFITCDSNKYFDSHAVEYILDTAEKIASIPEMCGVGGYRADFSGKIYGGEMLVNNQLYIDCSHLERAKYNLLGDKSTAFKTEVLRKYKSPIFSGETFITEAAWLIPMAYDGYIIRWIPKVLCYGEYEQDGLTLQGANSYRGHFENFQGYLEYIRVLVKARGISNAETEIIEAINIAKRKGISIEDLSSHIECRPIEIWRVEFCNMVKSVYYKLPLSRRGIRACLGDKRAESLKALIRKLKRLFIFENAERR